MASSSHDTRRASSDALECIKEIFTMEPHYYKRLRPRSLIGLKKVATLEYYSEQLSNDPEVQLLQKIRDSASEEVLESYLNLIWRKISDGELGGASLDEQGNEGDKRRALARARVYDKALGEAEDGTPIEKFLVTKLRTDESLQRGGHCEMVDCSAARWNMVNIVLASIRWRDAAESGRVSGNEELLAIAVEYGHVRLVEQLTQMRDHPEEQLLEAIRRGATPGEVESYLNLTFEKIFDGELAGPSLDEQGNEGDKRRALARARVYDKALGVAEDGTPIEKFLVTKLRTDESLQRGGHCEMVDCSAARWNMVNIVLASIRWRDAAESGRVSGNEELLAIAVEYGHVRLVEQLTQMRDHPEEQLLEAIRRGATAGEVESYLNLTLRKISDGELAGPSLDEQGNEGDKRRALARARVYDKALGEAEDGTPIEKFLVTKLRRDESLQRGGPCEMVDCSAARWNMVNIVLASIRWRDAAENGRVSGNEELLAIAVEYGHVRLVEQLTQMRDHPEEQLLEAIRRGATPGEVESYLNLTLRKISDGELGGASPDEQRNDGDKKRALARARVYDKALGEAKGYTPVEEFLVKKLQTDECLQKGGHCAMVDCSAARWNMVNIVLASIRWRGAAEFARVLRKEELLAIAIEYGHVKLVEQLTKMQDVDVNRPSASHRHYILNNERSTDRESVLRDFHVDFLKPIGSAARMGNVDMVMSLLACDRIDVNKGKPLHWAAASGHLDVVKKLLQSKRRVDVNRVKLIRFRKPNEYWDSRYGGNFTPLQLASLYGHASVVKALCEDTKGRLRANTENWRGITAFEIAMDMRHGEIVEILKERAEVPKYVDGLYRDRQAHVDAANAILVGAALIASVAFAGWLQPPLGYSAFFGSASIEVGAPSPSGIYPSFVSVAGHPIMQIFWSFNSMSFFFAIATLMVGANTARPPKQGIFIAKVVRSLRASLSLAYILLTISVGCVMGAFASAGFLVLPPIPKYMLNMRVTVGIGVTVVFLAWTSSKLFYVLKVMKEIFYEMIRKIL